MERRTFMKQGIATAAVLAAGNARPQTNEVTNMSNTESASSTTPLARRAYGKDGVKLSMIGFGGIVVSGEEQAHANEVVAKAYERGVNYFDVAPTYGDAEIKLGPALEPYRKDCFLACKTGIRTRPEAEAEFKRSLERLRTDHFDLYQLHGITDIVKDVDPVFEKGGLMEFLAERRKAGQIRYLGFSAHSDEAALAAMDRFDFDSALFPINFSTWLRGQFGKKMFARLQEKGMSLLALKAMACQQWPENDPQRQEYGKCWYKPLTDPAQSELALRWTLSQPITAALPPGEEVCFWQAVEFASRFKEITEAETAQLQAMAEPLKLIFSAA